MDTTSVLDALGGAVALCVGITALAMGAAVNLQNRHRRRYPR